MKRTETLIVGAGQAGLAVSKCLTDRDRDHVVVDRGRLAERWRSERWNSMRLLTPNWMTRLPGWGYAGSAPDAFMAVPDLVSYLEEYAASFGAPVQTETTVSSVRWFNDEYRVDTDRGTWVAPNVVIASGAEGRPRIPRLASRLPASITQIDSTRYRNPQSVPEGGVLVVGASATGIQLADELASSGRDVTLAVGDHSRMPRRYRGWDIFRGLQHAGLFDTTVDQLRGSARGSHAPSLQLVGRPTDESLDLNTLQQKGVQLAGRLCHLDGRRVHFDDDLRRTVAASDQRMHRVLDRIDDTMTNARLEADVVSPDRPGPTAIQSAVTELDLRDRGIGTVLWATGFEQSYPWLHLPVTDAAGEIRQRRGVTSAPGLFVVGLRFQHYWNSNFIDGVGRDAAHVARCIVAERAIAEGVAA